MNWLKKTIVFGERIKKILKKRPSIEEIESSEWTSCCKGPVLKKSLKKTYLFVVLAENIIELVVVKGLIFYLGKIDTKSLKRLFQ
jgi:hypothetical protein